MSAIEHLEKEDQRDYLLRYLMLKLAPVLVKLKPSCLLALCNCEKSGRKNHWDLWKTQKKDIIKKLGISFKELKNTNKGKQVLFYNPDVLFDTITQPENLAYLERFGYSSRCTLEDCLQLLRARFSAAGASGISGNGRSFPHEIGIFLGYPLKDVKGFIEKGSMPLAKIGRWQVFGESEKSIQLMNIHKKTEKVFLSFIKNRRNPLSFVERLNGHFRKLVEGVIIAQEFQK